MRDVKGGPFIKLWSHLIKTSVLHLVVRKPDCFWDNSNLSNCFIAAIQNLVTGLEKGKITDIFHPQVNLLDRITNDELLEDIEIYFNRKLRKFNDTDDILVFF